ncbi:UNVERIFIED_CONTAM: Phytanoyl-CoA dioxygenase (PhyH) superfamily protein [Hammondia hammondi]|eukprot:XP_008883522.1 Phytanoyl-CoA dioxygenase (PhyH) superfamily protein [Hammondia hammondi]
MTALNARASRQGRVFTAAQARRMAWRVASASPSSACFWSFATCLSPQLFTSLSSVRPLSFSVASSFSCVSSPSLLSPGLGARRFSSRCLLFPPPLCASSISSSRPSAGSLSSSSLSSSSASARFASSASSPLRQTATAAAAGRAAAAAAKRREERKVRERWIRLQKGLKFGGTIGAVFVVTAGSLAWFLSSLKRRHPPPPVDPHMSLPFPLADQLCVSPVPLSSLPTSSLSSSACSASCSRDSCSSCASSCASNCASACSSSRSRSCCSEGSGSRSLPNVFPSPEALTELSEKYPFFPASKQLFLKAASHALPLESHLHLRDAFCRYLALRLSEEMCKCKSHPSPQAPHAENKEQGGSACQREERVLTADKVKATMREIWEFLGVSTERDGDDGAHAFFSRIDFDSEIEAFLSRLQTPGSVSPCPSSSSSSPASSVEEFAERVKEKISDVLLTNWQRQRFFDPLTFKRSSFTRRISHEAAGRDVGTPAPSFSYADVDLSVYRRCTPPAPASSPSVPPSSSSSLLSSVVSFFLRPFATRPCPAPAVSKADSPSSSSLSSEPLFLGTHEVHKAVASLKEYGVCIIRGGLTRQQLDVLQRTLHTDEAMAMSSAMAMQAEDPNVWCTRPTTGRLHCLLRGTLLEAPLADAQRVWMPVVFSYLPCDARGGFTSEPDARLTSAWKRAKSAESTAGEKATGERGGTEVSGADDEVDDGGADPKKGLLAVSELSKRLFVSDMQTVDADPLAIIQPWHRDTSARSLTVLVPLCDLNEANGPTELLPRSHILCPSKPVGWKEKLDMWRAFFTELLCATGGSLRPTLKAGDILIYDSRVLHRGLGNATWHSRPVLAFRYDYEDQPPPGEYAKRWKSQRTFLFGRAVERLLGLYNQL